MGIDPDDFRLALGRFASGVTVVTVRDGDAVQGITVSAFLSLSLSPPLIGVSIDRLADAHGTLGRRPTFAVSILAEGQEWFSERFAGRPVTLDDDPVDAFAGHDVIRGALAHLVCRVVDRVPTGDHTLFVGEVDHVAITDQRPLLYFRSSYRRLE